MASPARAVARAAEAVTSLAVAEAGLVMAVATGEPSGGGGEPSSGGGGPNNVGGELSHGSDEHERRTLESVDEEEEESHDRPGDDGGRARAVCLRILDQFLYSNLLHKMGQGFLDT